MALSPGVPTSPSQELQDGHTAPPGRNPDQGERIWQWPLQKQRLSPKLGNNDMERISRADARGHRALSAQALGGQEAPPGLLSLSSSGAWDKTPGDF